jgi:hypothetical protein
MRPLPWLGASSLPNINSRELPGTRDRTSLTVRYIIRCAIQFMENVLVLMDLGTALGFQRKAD